MRSLLIRLAIVLSVFLASLHVPAAAGEIDAAPDGVAYAYDVNGVSQVHNHSCTPDDQSGETAHHHCPMAIDFGDAAGSGDLAPAPQLHFPMATVPLTSRATAPPIDPPLA